MSDTAATKGRAIVFCALEGPDDQVQPFEFHSGYYTEDGPHVDMVIEQYMNMPKARIDETLDSGFQRHTVKRHVEDILTEWISGLNDTPDDTSSPHVEWTFVMVSEADLSCLEALKVDDLQVDKTEQASIMDDFEKIVTYDSAERVHSKQIFTVQDRVHEDSGAITFSLRCGIHFKQTRRGTSCRQGMTEAQGEATSSHPGRTKVRTDAIIYQEKFIQMAVPLMKRMESELVRGELILEPSIDLPELTESILAGSDGVIIKTTRRRSRKRARLHLTIKNCAVSPESFEAIQSTLSEVSGIGLGNSSD